MFANKIQYEKKSTVLKVIFSGIFMVFTMINCGGNGNVDLSKATPLSAEVVQTPATPTPNTPVGNNLSLSSLVPGQVAALSSFGIVDPVGTTLAQDLDGDAIPNNQESLSNYWVAEYPVIDTQVAPPITMKIQILKSTNGLSSEIVSDINASDLESRKNEGSDNFHQNEVNEKTIHYADTVGKSTGSSSTSSSSSVGGNVGFSLFGITIGGSASGSSGGGYSTTTENTTSTQLFKDQPFKNNLDRMAVFTKADSAQKNSRQYRSEKRTKVDATSTVNADAGYVRAALYIENHSVNMPVNLSNILCSLLLETPTGSLIPVQSFKLRNADYSPFSINVYGGTQFGPYVIELTGLNTAEIENAIALGYTPKIHIVDYDMTHVPDSNYRAFLANTYTGNNLKIIEENAKGRTALVKIFAPQMREMFRIAAFDLSPMPANICDPNAISPTALLKAGSSIRNMVERLACSGFSVQFENYVIDFTGVAVEPSIPKVYFEGIKSINGIATTAPCDSYITGNGINGSPVTACVIKVGNINDTNVFDLAVWSVFSNGRFFGSAKYKTDSSGNILYFDLANTIPIVQGIESLVWPGDNFDITYLKVSDILGKVKQFGANPLETNASLAVNTKWKSADLGGFPYYPNVKSQYLGQAAIGDFATPGDQIVIDIKLDSTYYLNPSFGAPVTTSTGLLYNTFSYSYGQNLTRLFNTNEAFDFELNLGLGGTRADWYSIINTNAVNPANPLIDCGRTWDFVNQVYHVCVQLPSSTSLSSSLVPNSLVSLYLRSSLNNAYRDSIWPRNYANVRRFTSKLVTAVKVSDLVVQSGSSIGNLGLGTLEQGQSIKVGNNNYTVNNVTKDVNGIYSITLSSALLENHLVGDEVYILGNETFQRVSLAVDNNFYTDWNTQYPGNGYGSLLTSLLTGTGNCNANPYWQTQPDCQGYLQPGVISNWLGAGAYENNWNDASNFDSLLNTKFYDYVKSPNKKYMNLEVKQFDTLISSSNAGDQISPQVAISGNLALITWQSMNNGVNNDIRGRVVDTSTGAVVGAGDFLISSTNAGDQYGVKMAISGNLALVVWCSYDNGFSYVIRGRVVDVSTGSVVGAGDFLISSSNPGDLNYLSLAISGNRALVTWSNFGVVGASDIRGRVVDISTGVVGAGDFLISSSNAGDQVGSSVSVSGNLAIVVWQTDDFYSNWFTRGRVVNLSTGSVVGAGDFIISSSPIALPTSITVSGTRALVTFYDSYAASNIRGRLVDISTGGVIGAGDFLISSSNTGDQLNSMVDVSSDSQALVIWQSNDNGVDYDIRGRVVDMTTGSVAGANDFLISTTNAGDQNYQRLAISGNMALVTWQSRNNGANYDIRGRLVDVSTASPAGGGDFLIGTSSAGDQFSPVVAVSNNHAMVVWGSRDNGVNYDIRGSVINFDNTIFPLPYGLNHFFTSPLVERNYTVNARLKY
jgi:hypothetical protein